MADSDKNIIITPNRGATSQPQISFTGQGNDPITIRVLDGITGTGATAGGALSVEGSAGQLFSIVNRLGTGSIFSVNDISGIPSIDVDANGTIVFAGFTGNVGIGVTAPAQRLSVAGNISATGLVTGSRLVYALNGLTGGVTLNAGSNVTITSSVAGGITIASSGTGSGVSTLNGLSGAVGITAGANVTITVSGQTLTIASTGGGSTDVVTSFNGLTGAVTGVTVGGANTFTALNSFNAGISAAGGTFSALVTFTSGISAAGGITLASPNLTGTPTAPTAVVGTNTTQIATTAFVQNEIVADTVTAFNGRTGSVQGVSAAVAGSGISVSGATGQVTITNIGTLTVNGISGGITLNAGSNVTITSSIGGGITIAASGGGGGVTTFNGLTGDVTGTSVARHWFI